MTKFLFLLLAVISISNVTVAAEALVDLDKPLPELRLNDGRTLHDVRFISFAQSAAMARWDGGMGSIAYDDLPDDVLGAALLKAQDNKATRPAKPPSPPERGVVIRKADMKVLKNEDGYVTWSWLAEIANHESTPREGMAWVRLLDRNGMVMDETYSPTASLRAGGVTKLTGQSMTETAIYQQVARYDVQLKHR